jgi:chromosome segregation and condensation protein ScpB
MIQKSKERTTIVEALLKASDVPLTPNQIAACCGTKPVNVRVLLAKMMADGIVKKAAYGHYTLRGSVGIFSAASLAGW